MSAPDTVKREALAGGMGRSGNLRFALTFALIAAVLFAVYCFPYAENGISEHFFVSYLEVYARAAGSVLRVFEPGIIVMGNNIVGRFSMSIIKSCDAMEANILFCAAILAFPGAWRRKAIATIGGLTLLVAANLVRLVCLYDVGVHFPAAFEFMHVEVWPLLMIGIALLDFVAWIRWMRPREITRLSPAVEADAHVAS
jgi:exosortase/archaeosortase family protein